MDIKAATKNAGSHEVYTKGEVEYEAQTVENMRENVLKRAKQTLKELKTYQGGQLNAPMARSGRNCIKVKIGYGSRNAALFEYEKDQNDLRHNADTVEERREAAIDTIKTAIASIKAGGLDKYLEAYLITRRTRSINGTQAVQKPKKTPHLVGEKAAA